MLTRQKIYGSLSYFDLSFKYFDKVLLITKKNYMK